jgi:hypothetical protein
MVNWLFRNRQTNRITIAQFPNAALWIFLVAVALRVVFPADAGARIYLDWIRVVALAWWAIDELAQGVNPWRRLLGLGGCTFAAAGLVSLIT